MLQATLSAMPGRCRFWTDCQPLLTMVSKGGEIAEDPKNVYARVHSLVLAQLDDTPLDALGWMPAHTSAKQVGNTRKGDGELLTALDRCSNEEADRLAKKGAALHRVPVAEVNAWKEHFETPSRERSGLLARLPWPTTGSITLTGTLKLRGGRPRQR